VLPSLKALGLIAGPLICGAVLYVLEVPPRHPGVYVETLTGIYPMSGYTEQPATLFASASAKAETPPAGGRGPVTFFIVGDDVDALAGRARSARLFLVRTVDGEVPGYRPVAAEVRRIDAHVYGVSSDELTNWGIQGNLMDRYYLEARPSSSKPINVLVALTMDKADGSREIYPVLNYPPNGPRLDLETIAGHPGRPW
jgi:hypothetical protein